VSKETYYSVKRDLLQCQKRPTLTLTVILVNPCDLPQCQKRDLLQCQKRPTTVSKETYYSVKRALPAPQTLVESRTSLSKPRVKPASCFAAAPPPRVQPASHFAAAPQTRVKPASWPLVSRPLLYVLVGLFCMC